MNFETFRVSRLRFGLLFSFGLAGVTAVLAWDGRNAISNVDSALMILPDMADSNVLRLFRKVETTNQGWMIIA